MPEFAIFQNSATKRSAIWTVERGQWVEAGKEEYEVLGLIANLLRTSPKPLQIVEVLKIEADKIRKENNDSNNNPNN